MKDHEIYQVMINLSLLGRHDLSREDSEEDVRALVQRKLEGPGITASQVTVYRAFENK
jgi:hypothetical protein